MYFSMVRLFWVITVIGQFPPVPLVSDMHLCNLGVRRGVFALDAPSEGFADGSLFLKKYVCLLIFHVILYVI